MSPPPETGRDRMPTRLEPMLAVAGPAPRGPGWAFEIKWDGVRALAFVDGGRVTLRSRSGRDITDAYPELHPLGPALGSTRVVLDGEIVAFGPDGTPDFGLLSHRIHLANPDTARRAAAVTPVRYLVFDLLFLDGQSTIGLSYGQRRGLLAGLAGLAGLAADGALDVSAEFTGAGPDILAASAAAGLEGVVAKRRGSTYQPGRRSGDWVKVKNVRRQSVLIGGWEPGTGRRSDRIGALLVGVATPRGPRYAGQVGTGFTEDTLDRLAARLAPLRRGECPFSDVPPEIARTARWVAPELIAEVDYGAWTAEGRLRHPSFKGLRDDLAPADTRREGNQDPA